MGMNTQPPKPRDPLYISIPRAILASAWLYFPSLLFLLLVQTAFWTQVQGQDIMLAFAESNRNVFRFFFFLAAGFWIYLTWFSSRIVGEMKQQQTRIPADPITDLFRDKYPRLAGYAGFLIIELAIIRLPALGVPPSVLVCWLILLAGLVVFGFLDKWVGNRVANSPAGYWIAQRFWIVFVTYFVLIFFLSRINSQSAADFLWFMFGGVLLLHLIFLFYVNLRRRVVGPQQVAKPLKKTEARGFHENILAYFCITKAEKPYLVWLVWTSMACLAVNLVASFNPGFAVFLGPLTIVLLGFSILLAAGNIITAFSVRRRINFHIILIALAFIGSNMVEKHRVQLVPAPNTDNRYAERPDLATYLRAWLRRVPDSGTYRAYFILADGGASRSGFWTATVLGKLEDTSHGLDMPASFRSHLFCLSGASGGGVGVATFFSLLKHSAPDDTQRFRASADAALRGDYFSFTAARLLGFDYFYYLFPFNITYDRAAALGNAFENYKADSGLIDPGYGDPFSNFRALDDKGDSALLPILFINTTRMQDGRPGIVTNLKPEATYFGKRLDVLDSLDKTSDITLATAAILGSRFPYVSPAGNIKDNYFVDGGYFDNSGSGATQELIRGMLRIYLDSPATSIYHRIRNLDLRVLHIANSPVISADAQKPVSNIKNDLAAPLITLLGAYNMQTTVNDTRLQDFITDINSVGKIRANYHRISLYHDPEECKTDVHPKLYGGSEDYSMNWFMSDTTHQRMVNRLDSQPALQLIIGDLAPSHPARP
jgi:hypothetical protein